jgi:hypothetical protein
LAGKISDPIESQELWVKLQPKKDQDSVCKKFTFYVQSFCLTLMKNTMYGENVFLKWTEEGGRCFFSSTFFRLVLERVEVDDAGVRIRDLRIRFHVGQVVAVGSAPEREEREDGVGKQVQLQAEKQMWAIA